MSESPLVAIIMGSKSDWPTMKAAADTLSQLRIPFESRIVSAHRTPDLMAAYAKQAQTRGLLCIIAGAGGAAHLPGMTAAFTPLPVIGVPVQSHALAGLDSLLSIAQMPAGVPVGAVPINDARSAALVAVRIVALARPEFSNTESPLLPGERP
jgi:5-(carboxyamino)imidazole ribonucleotide mutase